MYETTRRLTHRPSTQLQPLGTWPQAKPTAAAARQDDKIVIYNTVSNHYPASTLGKLPIAGSRKGIGIVVMLPVHKATAQLMKTIADTAETEDR